MNASRPTRRIAYAAVSAAALGVSLVGAMAPAQAEGKNRSACPSTYSHGTETVVFCNGVNYRSSTNEVRAFGEIRDAKGTHAAVRITELDLTLLPDFENGGPSYLVEQRVFAGAVTSGQTAPTNCLTDPWYAADIKFSINWSDGTVTNDEFPVFYNPGDACK